MSQSVGDVVRSHNKCAVCLGPRFDGAPTGRSTGRRDASGRAERHCPTEDLQTCRHVDLSTTTFGETLVLKPIRRSRAVAGATRRQRAGARVQGTAIARSLLRPSSKLIEFALRSNHRPRRWLQGCDPQPTSSQGPLARLRWHQTMTARTVVAVPTQAGGLLAAAARPTRQPFVAAPSAHQRHSKAIRRQGTSVQVAAGAMWMCQQR